MRLKMKKPVDKIYLETLLAKVRSPKREENLAAHEEWKNRCGDILEYIVTLERVEGFSEEDLWEAETEAFNEGFEYGLECANIDGYDDQDISDLKFEGLDKLRR